MQNHTNAPMAAMTKQTIARNRRSVVRAPHVLTRVIGPPAERVQSVVAPVPVMRRSPEATSPVKPMVHPRGSLGLNVSETLRPELWPETLPPAPFTFHTDIDAALRWSRR